MSPKNKASQVGIEKSSKGGFSREYIQLIWGK